MEKMDTGKFVIPISYGSTEVIETGKWSSLKPQALAMTPPCREACPIGTDISLFLHFVEQHRYAEALSTILIENPFPGVCGRVCYHPCETYCNRSQFDEAVSVQMMERFVSAVTSKDIHIRPIENKDPKKIAILGSGPAGLSCAYFLALLGHRPTVFEAKKEPGGVMRWGIPQFRLPKAALKKDIRRILALPVKLRTNCRVGKDLSFRELEKFDAVFLSPGAGLNALLSIEGEDLEGVWNGGEFLERIKAEEKISLGQKTVVIGGGNTAMDVARSASRLGSSVTIAYRRTRDEMPAIRDEIDEAEEEGIEFKFLIQPLRIRQASAGKLEVTFQRMQLGARDESNRRRVIPIEGESLMLEADSVISAVGELVDLSSVPEDLVKDGYITSGVSPRIFAGGDAVLQPRTIANAIASAKAAAISMDLFFRGIGDDQIVSKIKTGRKGSLSMEAYLQARENGEWPDAKEVISHQQINTLYFEKSGRAKVRKLSRARRRNTFQEVNKGIDDRTAALSASRCYSCGTCNACFNCFYFCPEGAIAIDPEKRTRTVDLTHCKGCGTCITVCPRNAAVMRNSS